MGVLYHKGYSMSSIKKTPVRLRLGGPDGSFLLQRGRPYRLGPIGPEEHVLTLRDRGRATRRETRAGVHPVLQVVRGLDGEIRTSNIAGNPELQLEVAAKVSARESHCAEGTLGVTHSEDAPILKLQPVNAGDHERPLGVEIRRRAIDVNLRVGPVAVSSTDINQLVHRPTIRGAGGILCAARHVVGAIVHTDPSDRIKAEPRKARAVTQAVGRIARRHHPAHPREGELLLALNEQGEVGPCPLVAVASGQEVLDRETINDRRRFRVRRGARHEPIADGACRSGVAGMRSVRQLCREHLHRDIAHHNSGGGQGLPRVATRDKPFLPIQIAIAGVADGSGCLSPGRETEAEGGDEEGGGEAADERVGFHGTLLCFAPAGAISLEMI